MATTSQVTSHLWRLNLGVANCYLLESEDGLVLIDANYPDKANQVFIAIRQTGHDPAQIRHLILTHGHLDHAGSAAEIRRRTGAQIYAHPDEAELLNSGRAHRPGTKRGPGLLAALIYPFIKYGAQNYEPVSIDQPLQHGEIIPLAGGIEVIHTPGHSAGHVALLVQQENVLVAGDLAINTMSLNYGYINEDIQLARQSLLRVANYSFEQAVFGHGDPITKQANQRLRDTFSRQ